ncbi:unnamed protein product [Cyprideis torosa]|uniref:Uncharacterized protein n=1 Tax=Cyprideis torosa TaxID=163714 RepID=A0A7R8W780_9CRUS|nr:unnamed protein product [Cyprideis torosa]CAG0882514.1 unnamed protein product [Cyprideis torosa]
MARREEVGGQTGAGELPYGRGAGARRDSETSQHDGACLAWLWAKCGMCFRAVNQEERGGAVNHEERGGAVNQEERGGAVNHEERGGAVNQEERGGAVNQEERGGAVNQEERGGAVNQKERGGAVNQEERGGAVNQEERGGAVNQEQNTPPSPGTMARWQVATDCLRSEGGRRMLRGFSKALRRRHIVDCWEHMEQYRQEPNRQRRAEIAEKIIERFLGERADEAVEFEGRLRIPILEGRDGADPKLMDNALHWLENDLDKQVFQNFRQQSRKKLLEYGGFSS